MKFIATIENDPINIELSRNEENVVASIDGREYVLEASEIEPDVYLLKKDGRVFEVSVSFGEEISAKVNGFEIELSLSDPKALRGVGASGAASQGTAEIKTAMPGKVVRILVEPESPVEEGQAIIVVEAMKMQNEMKAPKGGVLTEVRFIEGDTVEAGDILAVIE